MAKPTIVLVPGSFSAIGVYDDLVVRLKAQGYPAVALVLPSTQKRAPLPPATLEDDVAEVKIAVETLIALGREVVVSRFVYFCFVTGEEYVVGDGTRSDGKWEKENEVQKRWSAMSLPEGAGFGLQGQQQKTHKQEI